MGKINLSGFSNSSIVDGPGVRFTVYTQGCSHHCKGCHNPETWSDKPNKITDIDTLIEKIENESLSKKVTISGGDPLYQIESSFELCQKLKELGYEIWLYTGYTLDEIENNPKLKCILDVIDTLVDGKFIEEKKDFNLKFRGSSNQNIIDLKKS